jgi:hypothetical protein
MLRVAIAVAVLAIYVYGLVDVIRTDAHLTRGFSKTTWIIIVVFLPLVGAALWFLIGRPRYSAPVQQQTYRHPTAPDDDPDFLRNLEQRRRNQAEAERLRKLKDDLESKKPKPGAGPRGGGSPSTGNSGTPGTAGDASAEGNPEIK